MTSPRYSLYIGAVLILALGTVALAGDGPKTLSITWQDKPLADALNTLQKHFGISYVLPAELGNLAVSANLWDATPETALNTIVSRAGLAAEDRNGTWVISSAAGAGAPGADLTFAQFPGMDMGMMGPGGPPGGFGAAGVPGLQMPGPTSGFGAPPGRGRGTTTQTTLGMQTEQQRPMHFIVIPLFRASPETVGYAIQADDVIYDMSGGDSGGGYGSSSGGYGSSSGGRSGGSSGYGSSSGSSRGSSRSSGSSGSSRGSSSRSSY